MAEYLDLQGKPFERKLVNSGGIRFHYVRGGKGPTVVLVAGFPQSCYAWRRVIPLLAQDFDVVALDLPARGCTVRQAKPLHKQGLAELHGGTHADAAHMRHRS